MIKKIINQTKSYTVVLYMALYAGSSMAQDASAIHGSFVVAEGEARFDQGDLVLSTISNTEIKGKSRRSQRQTK